MPLELIKKTLFYSKLIFFKLNSNYFFGIWKKIKEALFSKDLFNYKYRSLFCDCVVMLFPIHNFSFFFFYKVTKKI
jgi:hypothetical protein